MISSLNGHMLWYILSRDSVKDIDDWDISMIIQQNIFYIKNYALNNNIPSHRVEIYFIVLLIFGTNAIAISQVW